MIQHKNGNSKKSFATKYRCYYLIYWERHTNINHAIEREKLIKTMNRKRKERLIASVNPEWAWLNKELWLKEFVMLKLDVIVGPEDAPNERSCIPTAWGDRSLCAYGARDDRSIFIILLVKTIWVLNYISLSRDSFTSFRMTGRFYTFIG